MSLIVPPVQGEWIQWADWSDCSAECNGGIQTRRRSCQEPQGGVDFIPCNGNTQEWRMCNTQICDGRCFILIFLRSDTHL